MKKKEKKNVMTYVICVIQDVSDYNCPSMSGPVKILSGDWLLFSHPGLLSIDRKKKKNIEIYHVKNTKSLIFFLRLSDPGIL